MDRERRSVEKGHEEHPAPSSSHPPGAKAAPPVLVGILLSVAVAVVLAVVTTTTVLLGFIAGLIGTAIVLQYETLRRFEVRNELEDERSVLLAAIDGHPWLLEDLRTLAVSAGGVLRGPHHAELFVDLMRTELGRTLNFVEDLNRGRLRVPSGNVTPMSNQIDLVKKTVFATTIPEADADWWLSASGADYLERNRKAIEERKVVIERIILWDNVDAKLAELVRHQLDAKVALFFVRRNTVAADLQASIAIYDRSVVHDVIFNYDGRDIFYDYSLDASAIEQAYDKFARLKVVASNEAPADLVPLLERRSSPQPPNPPNDGDGDGEAPGTPA